MRSLFLVILLSSLSFTVHSKTEHQVNSEAAVNVLAASLGMLDPNSKMQLIGDQVSFSDNRELHQISLYQNEVGQTDILLSGPMGFLESGKKYPVLFVSAGFLSGKDSIKLIPDAEDKILVGYEYPANFDQIKKDPSIFPKTIKVVPGQIALTLEWLAAQSYTNTEKIHVMGVSLGSLFLPVSLHLAQSRNFVPTSTLLCFGGADLGMILDHTIDKSVHPILRELSKKLLDALTVIHDPKLHLPYLKGQFFTVYATEDTIFPQNTSLLQYELLPSPKEIHWVNGPHIDVDEPEVIFQTLVLIKDFLKKFE